MKGKQGGGKQRRKLLDREMMPLVEFSADFAPAFLWFYFSSVSIHFTGKDSGPLNWFSLNFPHLLSEQTKIAVAITSLYSVLRRLNSPFLCVNLWRVPEIAHLTLRRDFLLWNGTGSGGSGTRITSTISWEISHYISVECCCVRR
jgi:hypothetical protein